MGHARPLQDLKDQALQVVRFGDREQNGVVLRLGAALENAHGAGGVERGLPRPYEGAV